MKGVGRQRDQLLRCFVLATMLGSTAARADWPMARHDPQRTGAAESQSDIVKPAVYWRSYLGGKLNANGLFAGDVDQDGVVDIVHIAGGRVVAKHADGQALWVTPPLNLLYLVGVDDFDGDGQYDVLAASPDHAYIVSGNSGAIEWAEPDGEMGTLDGVRVGDFNSDGKPDVLVQESGCGGVNSGKTGFVYSFASGFASPTVMWTLPAITCSARGTTVFDADGDGAPEVALPTSTSMRLLSGKDGALIATSPQIGTVINFSICLPTDLDGSAGEELVCYQNDNQGPGKGGRKVYVLQFAPGPTPSLSVLWQHDVGDYEGGNLSVLPRFVADLDGDGSPEVVASGMNSAGAWTTYVFDGPTGAERAKLPGEKVAGTAPVVQGHALLLTTSSSVLSSWELPQAPATQPVKRWSMQDRALAFAPDWALARRTPLWAQPVTLDLDSDGIPDLVTLRTTPPRLVEGISAVGTVAKTLATYTVPKDVDPLGAWLLPPTNKAYQQVAVARNDGFLAILDSSFSATNASPGPPPLPGLQFGGYYAGAYGIASFGLSPIVGGPGKQSLLIVDSRGSLVRLDAGAASLASPPIPLWSRPRSAAPVLVSGSAGGQPAIACRAEILPATTPPTWEIASVALGGTTQWSAPIPDTPQFDVVPGNADGDGVPDFFVQFLDANTMLHTRAISGLDSHTIWDASPVLLTWGAQPFAVSDWDKDGKSDVLAVMNELRAFSGANGVEFAKSTTFLGYFMPLLLDTDGDKIEEVVLQGGYYPARELMHDLKTEVWVGTEDDRPYPYGAVASCPSGPVLVEGSLQNPARLRLTKLGAASQTVTFVLASGSKYANESVALAEDARLGQLGNVSVSSNLTGTQHPSAVVGSTDGWLYAVNPCFGNLDFSLQFGAAVGESVFGDTNGDGKDEILATVADGFLYDIQNEATPPPQAVIDTDPIHGVTDADVDEIITTDTLFGRWSTAPGATGYEVAVAIAGGGLISPGWTNVGTATSAKLAGLPLVSGAKYLFAVRAIGSGGVSPDVLSDGVLVISSAEDGGSEPTPDGGDASDGGDATTDASADASDGMQSDAQESSGYYSGGGCDCGLRSAPPGDSSWIAATLVAVGAALRRRRSSSADTPRAA